jgi:hypothetical protein
MIRRELRRIVDVNVPDEEIVKILATDVIKRDAMEGPEAEEALYLVKRGRRRSLRAESKGEDDSECPPAAPAAADQAAVQTPPVTLAAASNEE